MGNSKGFRGGRGRTAHHGSRRRGLGFMLLILVVALVSNARAQQQFSLPATNSLKDIPVTDTLKAPPAKEASISNAFAASPPPPPSMLSRDASPPEEEDFIKPSRPSVANPAEIQKPGVLQVEYGYDANFRSRELHTEQTGALALRFAAASRLLLELDLDTFKSETDEATRQRETGIGDARVGLQVIALKDTAENTRRSPSLTMSNCRARARIRNSAQAATTTSSSSS